MLRLEERTCDGEVHRDTGTMIKHSKRSEQSSDALSRHVARLLSARHIVRVRDDMETTLLDPGLAVARWHGS